MRPGRAEIITGDGRHGLPEVEQAALCAAAALRTRGVAAGDRVLLAAGNSAGYVAALLALMHLDASIVLVDHRAAGWERTAVAGRSGAAWLVHNDPGRAAGSGPASVQRRDRRSQHPPHAVDIAELVATGRAGARELGTAAWRRRRDALIGWSSGTTGEPKGVVRSGAAVLDNIRATADRMGYRPDDVLLPLLPFSHQYGLSLVLLCWTVRCGLVIPPHTRLDHALRFAAQAGVTVLDAPPATYHSLLRLLDAGADPGAGLATVRMCCVGGAPLGRQLARTFRQRTGQPLLDGYGSTEAGNIALASPEHPVGCGRPLDGVELRIRAEDGREAAAGTVGELSVRTPGLLTGYLGPHGVVQPFRADHYRTGDLGYRDAAGNVFVVGRKHAVHRLGYTLYPEALAAAAEGCGQPVRVVPVPDERLGHRLVFVVQDDTGQDARHWRRLIAPHLEVHAQPNLVLVVGALPANRNGKTDTAALAQLVRHALERTGPHTGDPTAPPADRTVPNTAAGGTGCRPQTAPGCAPSQHGGNEPHRPGAGTGTGTDEGRPMPP